MTKVLLIGNSHLGALKEGLSGLQQISLEFDFFGAPATQLANLRIEGTRLVAGTERLATMLQRLWGRATIDLEAYDALAVVGVVNTRDAFEGLYDEFRADAHARTPGRHRVSDATFARAVAGRLAAAPAVGLARDLAAAIRGGVLLIPPPAICHSVVGVNAPPFLEEAVANGDASVLADTFHAVLAAAPGVAGVLSQPTATLATPLTTREDYMVGGVRLRVRSAAVHETQDDIMHANAHYGALVIGALAAQLGSGAAHDDQAA